MVNVKKSKKGVEFTLKEKVLKLLIENKEPLSILQISKRLGADYKNTYNAIKSSSDVIVQDKKGNATFIEIKMMPQKEIYNIEYKRTKEFLLNNPKIKLIKEDIKELNYPFMIVLIFGSYAKGTNSSSSDLDLCIISDNKNKSNKLMDKLRLLSLRTEVQEFTTDEFISMIEKKQNNLGHEIIKNNVILFGIENYYNFISKWMTNE